MESIEFEIARTPSRRAAIDKMYASLVARKGAVKQRSLQMMGVGVVIYIACFSSWMMYRDGVLSALYPMASLGAALGWMLGTHLHQIYTSAIRNRAILITGSVALILSLFSGVQFGQEVALFSLLAYLLVIAVRYFFDNRVVDIIALNQQIRDYSYLDVSDTQIQSELSRMRAISDPIDHYLNGVNQLDRPLVVAEFVMLSEFYQLQQGASLLASAMPELGDEYA